MRESLCFCRHGGFQGPRGRHGGSVFSRLLPQESVRDIVRLWQVLDLFDVVQTCVFHLTFGQLLEK